MKRSKDEYLKEYPTEVDLSFTHNHSIDSAEALRYRHPTQELENAILNYFANGHSPSSALESYKTDLYINYGSEYFKIIADGSKCPTRKWCYDLYYKIFKKHYSEPSGDEMMVTLEKAVEEYNNAENQMCAAVRGSDDSIIAAICTPLMKRVYGLESSEEIMFVDSSNNMGKNNRRTVLIFLCPSVAGALPLGIIVTSSNNECIITEGIALLMEISGFKNFSPKIIMTGDCAAEQNSVQRAFPLSNLLLCRFCVLQSVWHYLFDRTNKVEESDRQHLYRLFHKTLNEETKEGFERNFEEMLSSSAMKKYRNYVQFLTDFYKRSSEWAMYARTELIRDNRAYIVSEDTMRVLKDRILKCTKAFNVIQLFDFLIKNFSSYYERIIIDMINNRTEDMMKSKYFVADDEIQNLGCHQISESCYAVMSGDDTYFVDFALETCTCPVGREGSSCKHQYAVVKKFNLISESFVPLTDNAAKKSLYFIATGIPNVSDSVFDVLPLKQEDETLDDLEATFEALKDKLISDSATFQEPIKTFVDNFKKLISDSGLISALHNFGIISDTEIVPTRKRKSIQRGSREVLVQPTVPQRILPRVGCKEAQLHSKPMEMSKQDLCHNKVTMSPIMSESPVKKQKFKTALSVEQSIIDKVSSGGKTPLPEFVLE
ncbi:hypothetical protein PR048_001929 [Dryococelus australis]|uniref:SWIM-type domain-containing protein n=1 Tax=Dryococelus australis TaxID=614101 RepID=A0ABQ9IIQ0_9NEOP|nr:hypothetical protein PR048_001929 [Dryococelus australis]